MGNDEIENIEGLHFVDVDIGHPIFNTPVFVYDSSLNQYYSAFLNHEMIWESLAPYAYRYQYEAKIITKWAYFPEK